jgi:hypothetical protein
MPDEQNPGKPGTLELVDKESGLSQLPGFCFLSVTPAVHAMLITILPKCWLAVITDSASTMSASLNVL